MKYTFDYEYDEKYAHRLIHAGNLYYQYDVNGNVICEQDGSFESNGDGTSYCKITEEAENVYSSAYGWGLWREEVGGKSNGRYRRTYSWNERNQLVCSQDSRYTTTYDENRRWLDTIKTTSATDQILQNMTYNFDKVGNVRGYENIGENYKTAQNYKYDSLYQLVGVKGQTEYKPRWPEDHEDHHKYVSTYEQSFRFDNIGNMKSKYSEKLDKPHNQHTSSDLNYSFEYKYDPEYAHRTLSADNMYYSYDENGNIINERIDREATKEELEHDIAVADEVYSLDYGIALPNQPSVETKAYSRTYVWNERNLLRTSVENGLVVQYRYGEDGQRAVKSSSLGETLYFNNMWQMSTTPMGMRQTKHIFVGETRIATKNNWWQDTGTEYEKYNTYWYHADHLGSAQLVSNWKGEEYERIEYTPYGEIWVEKVKNGHESINYRFTGKEMDSETGLYYFGARYLDPKYSRWLSTDPALRDYIPQAPVNDEARKANNNLPGQGGLFNQVNFHLYHYAGNNPVRYIDPDGRAAIILPLLPAVGSIILKGAAIAGAILSGIVVGETIKDGIQNENAESSSVQQAEKSKQKIESNAQSVTPNPEPLPPSEEPNDNENNNQSAKDAKKLDGNKEANKFAQDKGYNDAHDLKKDYVGKDNISKYDIYKNNKTGESFLINKSGTSIVQIE